MQLDIVAVGTYVDLAGVVVMLAGLLVATVRYALALRVGSGTSYVRYRHDLGRAILLGLEVLVAGDIIRTVAATPSLLSVAVLGGIVLIRTFLSFSLEVELEGRWPWRTASADDAPPPTTVGGRE